MIKLVWRTDVHMADRGPASRVDDWTETVLDKLAQVRDVARKEKAVAVIDGGDFFHVKSPSRNTHETIRRVADLHATYPCPVYCTPGNHDSVYGDYNFLGQQPLGVLFSTGVFKKLYHEHEATFTEGGVKVRVVGIPYHGPKYNMGLFHDIERGDEDVLICTAHVLASEKGGSMFEGEDIVRYSDLLDTAPDVYCFGHWHKDQGVEELGGKHFINIGSLTRGALSQDEVQRRPACAIIECTKAGATVKVHRLKVKPAEEVFDVEGRARQVRQQMEMDSFVEKIRESLEPSAEEASMEDEVGKMEDVPEEVREKALFYMEQAE